MRKYLIMLLSAALLVTYSAAAQTGGQFCVRAFEDRNKNGVLDPGEPFLTKGVSAQLMDSSGVIVSSALLDNSPTATQGVICFTGLTFGQYSMMVTSAEFDATTPNQMTVSISAGQLPTVLDFGAQRVTAEVTTVSTTEAIDQNTLLERALIAGLGALGVILAMTVLGGLIYLIFFRGRLKRAAAEAAFLKRQSTTGSFPVVQSGDTGEYRRY